MCVCVCVCVGVLSQHYLMSTPSSIRIRRAHMPGQTKDSMARDEAKGDPLTGVLEDDVQKISLSLIGRPPEEMERAAANVIVLARQGVDERRALVEEGIIHSLTIMCSRDFTPKTQAKGALALAALCSNFSSNQDESKMYVCPAAQEEALQRGAVTLITPILTAWQPDAQAAAANALANIAFRNSEVRKVMLNMEASRALVNLLHRCSSSKLGTKLVVN